MKKLVSAAICGAAMVACAQLLPGEGVANDHATGSNPHDVVFVARGAGNGYGYRAYETAVGLTILPWSCPNFESSVKGVRINLGWGSYAATRGFDSGLFSNSGDFCGLAVNLFGNYASADATGVQIGLVNVATHATGLQIGLVNHVESLAGVQIGLLNFAQSQWSIPLINVAW